MEPPAVRGAIYNTPAVADNPQAVTTGLTERAPDGISSGSKASRPRLPCPEHMMTAIRLIAGRPPIAWCVLAAGLLAAWVPSRAAEPFPFDQELLLDVRPMPPVKRVPVLLVAPNGAATIDLWCQTVKGRVQLSDSAIRIEPGPLPVGLPRYMSDGQCTPERMQADQEVLAEMVQVTGWRRQGDIVVLIGPRTFRYRLGTN
jgi:hypothetical protein